MPTAAGLYYFVHETDDTTRPPLILIRGAGGFHLSWPPQVRRLAGERIYAVDLPGHGKSEGVGRQSIEEYADDMAVFMDARGIHHAVVAGHSMGSAIAITLALRHPKQILGLVLIGSGAKLRVAPAFLEGVSNANTFVSTVQKINDCSFGPDASPRLKELATQRMGQSQPSVLYNDYLACDAFNAMDQIEKIKVPTLILCGTEDKMTPLKYSKSLREGIGSAQLVVVEDAGHMLMLEQPFVTADLISKFMKDLPPRAER
jgi:pimeloyl-ACP methyl ester carboxylesterase